MVESAPNEIPSAGDFDGAIDELRRNRVTLDLVERDEVGSTFETTALDQLLADLLVVHDHVP